MTDELRFLVAPEQTTVADDGSDGGEPFRYVLERPSALAVNLALGAGRPLLVRGEPGTGKSTLAQAVSLQLGRAFVSTVLDAQTEPRDLFWTIDAVARLAEAQVQGALPSTTEAAVRERLAIERFLEPGPLWWGFDWETAKKQAEAIKAAVPDTPKNWTPNMGVVVLIDEIDKADPSVPNSLLEAFGAGRFMGPHGQQPIRRVHRPLVVLTTNEERVLPDAFLRRCVVLHLKLPTEDDKLLAYLLSRGEAHFPTLEGGKDLLERAAQLLIDDRKKCQHRGLVAPGVAEYIDLIRAVVAQRDTPQTRLDLLEDVAAFALKKHPEQA